MAASVRDGAAAAAAGHAVDANDVGASDGEMDVEVGSEYQARDADRRDGEGDDEYALPTRITDTSAAEARAGKDIQGIPWERLQITRQDYRKARLEQYKNYENFPQSGELMDKLCKQVEKSSKYYEFQYNSELVKPSILHFQLRNLLWATSKHDVYFMSNSTVGHWSSLSHSLSEVLDLSGHVAPAQKHPGSLLEGFTGVQVSTLAVNEGLLVAGGFQGELVCKVLGDRGVKFCTRTTLSDNAITNAIDIHRSTSGSLHITVSNNDCGIREFDMERFQLLNHFRYNWPVNHTSVSPDRKLLAVVGDDRDALLVDSRNGKVTSTLVGHLDYSFASAWHPDGCTFATGNQDKTCRVWDIRNLSTSLSVLRGNIGAIRCIRYSSDGRFMLFSEPADFVHVYHAASGYRKNQEIDFFGEISGISLSPDDESLFVGVCDRVYASLLNYRMIHAFNIKPLFRKIATSLPGMDALSSAKQEDLVDINLKPWPPPVTGIVTTIMTAFGAIVSRTLGLPSSLSVGLILLACCLGGTAFNVVTLVAKVNAVKLSLSTLQDKKMLHPTGRLIAFAILHQSYSLEPANPYVPLLLNATELKWEDTSSGGGHAGGRIMSGCHYVCYVLCEIEEWSKTSAIWIVIFRPSSVGRGDTSTWLCMSRLSCSWAFHSALPNRKELRKTPPPDRKSESKRTTCSLIPVVSLSYADDIPTELVPAMSSSVGDDLPVELLCQLCKKVMIDTVLTSRCFDSFCDKCIQDYIIAQSKRLERIDQRTELTTHCFFLQCLLFPQIPSLYSSPLASSSLPSL